MAVEENLFDLEAVSLGRAENSRVERRAFGQSSNQRQNLFADHCLALFGLSPGSDRGNAGGARSCKSGCDSVKRTGEMCAANLRGTIWVWLGIGTHSRRDALRRSAAYKEHTRADHAKKR